MGLATRARRWHKRAGLRQDFLVPSNNSLDVSDGCVAVYPATVPWPCQGVDSACRAPKTLGDTHFEFQGLWYPCDPCLSPHQWQRLAGKTDHRVFMPQGSVSTFSVVGRAPQPGEGGGNPSNRIRRDLQLYSPNAKFR